MTEGGERAPFEFKMCYLSHCVVVGASSTLIAARLLILNVLDILCQITEISPKTLKHACTQDCRVCR